MDKKDLQEIVGNNLQKYRTKAKLTQDQVAERAGISTSHYANLERGNRSMSAVVLRSLAEALGVSTDCLLYEDSASTHIENIRSLLSNKPETFVAAVEGILCALIEGFLP